MQYSVNLTADGGLEMNLKKLKTPSVKLRKLQLVPALQYVAP